MIAMVRPGDADVTRPYGMPESERLKDAVEQLERYGPPDHDVMRVIDVPADLIDDRNHGRDLGPVRANLEAALGCIEWGR